MSMESSNFEIRIFANIAGIDEIKFGNTNTLSARVVSKDVLDSKRGMFQTGTFVVFYSESVYVLVKLLEAPAEARYRDSMAYVCVAVRRGYQLKEAKWVMDELDKKFFELASYNKENVASALSKNKDELYQIVSGHIKADADQPVYPVFGTQAIVSYKNEEELKDLLDYPIRKQFTGLYALYILSQDEAAAKWSWLKDAFRPITDVGYPYQRTYLLRYPDGTEETINGLDQKVNRTCVKLYCAPLAFKGRLIDHMEDWQISLNAEKTVYTIGRVFEPEQKTYVIVAHDEQGNLYPGLTYTATVGTVVNDKLTLNGEDIDKDPALKLQDRPDLKIVTKEIEKESLQIKVKIAPVNLYNVSTLWEIVENTVGHKQDISISLVDLQTRKEVCKFSKRKLAVHQDLPYNQAAYKVGRTKKYEECMVFLNSDGTAGAYKPQPVEQNGVPAVLGRQDEDSKKLKVTFKMENVRLCQKLTTREKTVYLELKKIGEIGKMEPITQSSFSIELPPANYVFTLQTKGYKKCIIKKNYLNGDAPQGGNEDVIPVTFEKPFYKKYACRGVVFLGILLVGFSLGFWVGKSQVKEVIDTPDNVKEFIAEHKELKENNKRLRKDSVYLAKENEELKALLQNEGNLGSKDNKVKETKDQKRNDLITKLNGIEFTQPDIKMLESMSPNENEKKLIESCDACLKLLNAPLKTKKIKGKKILGKDCVEEQIMKKDGYMFNLYRQITISSHKKAMDKILTGEYARAYKTVNRQNFTTITDALNEYKKQS